MFCINLNQKIKFRSLLDSLSEKLGPEIFSQKCGSAFGILNKIWVSKFSFSITKI